MASVPRVLLLVAQVPLSIQVRGAGERQEDAEASTATAPLFGSVFASYAHEDGPVAHLHFAALDLSALSHVAGR
jgi:hypothetical protein